MSGDRAVVTLLYRCMLRWHKALSSVPLELRPSHVDEVLPGFRKQQHGDVSSIRDLAQWGFRQHDAGSAAVLVRFVRSDSREDCCKLPMAVRSMCKYQHALQGQHLSQDEHKELLLDKGFRVSFLVANEP